MHHLAILLPHGDNFNRVNKSKTKSEYYGICDDCGFDANEYERISIGFIQPHMLLLVNVQRLPKGFHQTTSHHVPLPSLYVLCKKIFKT